MKKYISVFFVFAFILSMFAFNAKPASALMPPYPYPAGCTSTVGYSPLTGVKCDTVVNPSLPAGCTSTLGYSPLTGTKCDSYVNTSLPAGCTSTLGYSPTTGVKCDRNGVTPSYPPGCTSNSGYSVTTGQSCGIIPTPVGGPVISGVSGPQTLNVNQTGTWTVTAYDSNGGNLSYHVDWGEGNDNPYGLSTNSSIQQSATFTHAYSSVGIRTVTFEVKNNMGKSAQTSLSVSVGNVTPPSSFITVLSPNGGETWTKGTTYQYIKWQDSTQCVPSGETCFPKSYDISLQPYYPPCTTNVCPKYVYRAPYMIANAQGSSYYWPVGLTLDNSLVPDGSYTIQVCQYGTSVCDSSNAPFTITSGTTTPTTITSISPTSAKVGDTVTIYGLNFDTVAPFIYLTNGYLAKVLTPITSSSTQISFSVPFDLSVGAYTVQAISRANSTSSDNSVYFTVVAATTSSLSITTPSPLPNAKVGNNYIQTIYANSVVSGWSISAGSLPLGIIQGAGTCDNNICNFPAVISGISTTTGTYTFTLTAFTDSQQVSKQFTLTVSPADVTPPTASAPVIASISPTSGSVGTSFVISGSNLGTSASSVIHFGSTDIRQLSSWFGPDGSSMVLSAPVPNVTSGGIYPVSVTNTNGTSNPFNFTVTGQVQGAQSFHFTQLLQFGSTGNEVTELQKFLNNAKYYTDVIDGNFGAKTEAAVIKLQTANGLVGDGIVGALTRDVLNK